MRHLVAGQRSVLASPASFNNTGGLSRTLNEHLTPGTEVFVAEMGTFGPGEIRVDVPVGAARRSAAIVNIGPVHLERMKTLDGIVAAKAEIFEQPVTRTAVLNIDAHGLAGAGRRSWPSGASASSGCRRASTSVDVCVRPTTASPAGLDVCVGGELRHRIEDTTAQPANVAAALGLALALDLADRPSCSPRLDSLPESEHRQQVVRTPKGVIVIDNTFSSNPASAKSSLALAAIGWPLARGRAVVVTPGMVELGRRQFEENRQFAIDADDVATDFVVVGPDQPQGPGGRRRRTAT